ncbi:MAG: hypothetical protein ACRDPC_19560 [Solirubrobacteraceae bacterium]
MRRERRTAGLALLAAAAVLIGCGGGGGPPDRTPTPTESSEGRQIGGASNPSAEAIATSTRFVRGYLAFQAGRLEPDQVPDATPELRNALKRLRVPPASQGRETRIVGAQLERIDARSARVTVQVRNVDEQLTYPLPIDLVRRDDRWAVLSAGDDT